MILKFLLVLAVIGIVYFIFIKKKPTIKKTTKKSRKTKEKPRSNDMIECATCGIYCEVDESILSNAKYYCSSECLEKA